MPEARGLRLTIRCLVAVVVALVCLALAGLGPMRPMAAFLLLCSAAALLLASFGSRSSLISGMIGAGVATAGLLLLLAYPTATIPPPSAATFLVIGCVFVLFALPAAHGAAIGHGLLLPAAMFCYVMPLGHLFDQFGSRHGALPVMFPLASLACAVLCTGMFLARPDTWLMEVFLRPQVGGAIARRLFVPALIVLPLIHTLLEVAENEGLVSERASIGIFGAAGSAVLVAALWLVARSANQASERQRQAEEHYRALVELSPDAVLVIRNHRIAAANSAAARLLRARSVEELIGRLPTDFVRPDRQATMWERAATLRQGGSLLPIEEVLLCLDGTTCAVEGTGSLFGRDSIQIYLRDISERKRAEAALVQQREWLRVTLTSIGDAVLAADAEGRVTFVNPTAATLLGCAAEQLIGRPVSEVFRVVDEGTGEPMEDVLAQALREGRAVCFARRSLLLGRDAREISIEDSAAPITDDGGRVAGVVMVFRDVTGKRRSEDALRDSEQRTRHKLESIVSPAGDIGSLELKDIVDSGAIQAVVDDLYRVSHLTMAMIDLKGKVLVGAGFQEICTRFHRAHPECHRKCTASNTECSAGIAPGEFRLYKCPSNMWSAATPIVVEGRHIGSMLSGQFFFEDEQVDRELFRAQAREYGFDEEAYLAALDAVPRVKREFVESGMQFLTGLGHLVTLLSYTNLKLARSVAERDALALSLRESSERVRRTQEIARMGGWELDLTNDRLVWSEEVYRIFGLAPGGFGGNLAAFLELVHPDDREQIAQAYTASLQEGREEYEVEHRLIHGITGEVCWVVEKGRHLRDETGRAVRSTGMVMDITRRKVAEEALQRSEALYRATVRNLPEAVVYVVDSEMRLLMVEGRLLPLLGRRREDLEGHAVAEVLNEATAQRFRKALEGETVNLEERHGDLSMWASYVPLRDPSGQVVGATAMWIDITEHKRVERQLREAQKMESVGMLAGGIAHDFNNLLVGVIGNAGLAEAMLPADSPVIEVLKRIVAAGEQAAHLTSQMLAYAGKGRFVLKSIDLSQLVRDTGGLVQGPFSWSIEVRRELASGLPLIACDPSQMQQVLVTLARNAAEAMSERPGVITISTGEAVVDADYIRNELEGWSVTPGSYVFLEVRDTGCGMDGETLSRVFDPFFTTKFQGRGLGLAAVSGIVRALHGAVHIVSRPGAGSTFRVLIPSVPAAAAALPPPPEPRGEGTVLVVDDEAMVREVARRSLERYGYEVLMAATGPEAIEAVRAHGDRIRLIILDLSMPGMSGEETLPRLRAIRPDVPVMISSGYSQAEAMSLFRDAHVSGFVHKPFSIAGLAREVQAAMVQPVG